eukprot:TRINITY_DN14358_c0_g2_i1.p1 TRINITY_DN14358_c0_g2~~TRINITY_DN14358_c0_g2_i1.p1  ORF type:complete len:174 (-),score=29.33 TRINITY_DN14358_c0_g2_i1:321-842(-)
MLPNSSLLSVKALTWLRSTSGLFDYDTLQLNKNTLESISDCRIIRCKNEVSVLMEPKPFSSEEVETLAHVQSRDGTIYRQTIGNFFIASENLRGSEHQLWLIANSTGLPRLKRVLHGLNSGQKLFLEAGSVLKLGQVKLLVRRLHLHGFQGVDIGRQESLCTAMCSPAYVLWC